MNWTKIKAMVLAFFALSAEHNEPIELTAEQKEKLDTAVKQDGFAEKFEAKFNEDLDSTKQLDAISEEIDAFMTEENVTGSEGNEAPDGIKAAQEEADKSTLAKVKEMQNSLKAERTKREKLEANFKKLKKAAEPDNPETIKGNIVTTMKHSDTHLMASNNSWDAFANRPWNKLAAKIEGAIATTWNAINIDKLNSDIQDYFRKDPMKLHNMMLDALNVPKYWRLISNVSDEYVHVTFTSGEITQGIKDKWLPKNKIKFSAQIGKVRDIQIDIEFSGNELKKMEKSYLNYFFNEGSDPYKMSFVLWVTQNLLAKARKEDKVCLGRGVYAPNISTTGGSFLNNFSGVIKLALEQRGNTYKPFKIGVPTTENIHDYVRQFVDGLPYDFKNLPDLVMYVSPSWVRAYNDARRRIHGRDQDYNGDVMTVDGYPNVELYPYDQLEGTDFMFLTTQDNIYILTDKLGEDNVIQFVKPDARMIKGSGDYKLAAFIAVFGRDLIGDYANTYENQLFFSNDVEVLTDVYVPVEGNNTTPSLKHHNALMVGDNNTAATNITDFTDKPTAGTKVYLKGSADANFSTVKNGANISLIDGNDCVLTKNTLLVLYTKADGTFQELYRETLGVVETEEAKVVIDADATTIDAATGTSFVTSENTQATALTNITNAVQGETYRIEGGSSTNPTTIDANADNFELTAAITFNAGAYIEVYYNGNKFVELNRG